MSPVDHPRLASEAPLARSALAVAIAGVIFGFCFVPQLLGLALGGFVFVLPDVGAQAHGIGARVLAHLHAGCDLVLACFPAVVAEAIAAMPPAAKPRQNVLPPALEALRGELGATWDELANNPQRDRFVARITALNPAQGVA